MIQTTNTFHVSQTAYKRTRLLSVLWCGAFLLCAVASLFISSRILPTYPHTFTPYLRWQDALVALLWFVACLSLVISVLAVRFLFALHKGYKDGMVTLQDKKLTVRDLSHENLFSVFWMMHAAFWCFVVVLIGLLPLMLIGWTLHLPSPTLSVFATILAVVVSVAGLVLSVVFFSFILIGTFGVSSYYQKLGSPETYKLDEHTTIRLDGAVLTIIYPGTPESMLNLSQLDNDDQQHLLSLLHDYTVPTQNEQEAAPQETMGKPKTVLV